MSHYSWYQFNGFCFSFLSLLQGVISLILHPSENNKEGLVVGGAGGGGGGGGGTGGGGPGRCCSCSIPNPAPTVSFGVCN